MSLKLIFSTPTLLTIKTFNRNPKLLANKYKNNVLTNGDDIKAMWFTKITNLIFHNCGVSKDLILPYSVK